MDTRNHVELSEHISLFLQMRRIQSDIQHRTTRFHHELKKREHESLDLKKRLHTLFQTGVNSQKSQTLARACAGLSRKTSTASTSSALSINSTDASGDGNPCVQVRLAQRQYTFLPILIEIRPSGCFYPSKFYKQDIK